MSKHRKLPVASYISRSLSARPHDPPDEVPRARRPSAGARRRAGGADAVPSEPWKRAVPTRSPQSPLGTWNLTVVEAEAF